MREQYSQYLHIYRDGSMLTTNEGCGVHIEHISKRNAVFINKFSSTFLSELYDILYLL